MPINSKQKGNDFELKVAKRLSEWSGEKFHRTPASGALHWENDKRVVSDIVPPQSLSGWPFSIECKKVETSWEFNTLIEGTSQTIKEHWEQCISDATREEMIPLLVFTKNYRDTYAILETKICEKLEFTPECYIKLHANGQDLLIFRFSEFLETYSLQSLLNKKLLG